MADISKITLPSGTTYNIKDEVARNYINGGSFIVAWDGTIAPTAANIPAGVVVTYNSTNTTGTLATTAAVAGAFYLVKSSTLPSAENLDIYDEYVVIKPNSNDNTTWFWEKIGDTKINLANVVTNVTLNQSTASVIGDDATFKITQPTIALETGASAGTGVINVATGISSTSASGDTVTALTGLGSPSTTTVLTGVTVTTQPSVTLTANSNTSTGRITYVQGVSANTTNIAAKATGASTAWNSKDQKAAVTGYASPSSDTFVKTVSTTSKKLTTTSVTGVNGSVTASKATAATNQTTVNGSTNSTDNSDFLADVSVSNETLVLGAKKLTTQTTTQFTFSDVTVPKAATSATTVATGAVSETSVTSNVGATIVTAAGNGTTASALTGLGSPTTANVIGASSTFTITQPTITLTDGDTNNPTTITSVATGVSPTTKYLSASASGTAVGANGTAAVVTGYPNIVTDEVLGTGSTITVTPTTTNIKATASGANTQWNNKDSVTVLTNSTGLTLTHGQ